MRVLIDGIIAIKQTMRVLPAAFLIIALSSIGRFLSPAHLVCAQDSFMVEWWWLKQCDTVRHGGSEPCDSEKDSFWLCFISSSGHESSIVLSA